LAENVIKCVSKGMRIVASGTLRVRRWERDERSGLNVDVTADGLGIDLRWGKVTGFERTVGPRRRQDTEDEANGADPWLPDAPDSSASSAADVADDDATADTANESADEGTLTPF